MDKPKRMDMRAPGNVSETCLAEYQTQPAANKPNILDSYTLKPVTYPHHI